MTRRRREPGIRAGEATPIGPGRSTRRPRVMGFAVLCVPKTELFLVDGKLQSGDGRSVTTTQTTFYPTRGEAEASMQATAAYMESEDAHGTVIEVSCILPESVCSMEATGIVESFSLVCEVCLEEFWHEGEADFLLDAYSHADIREFAKAAGWDITQSQAICNLCLAENREAEPETP